MEENNTVQTVATNVVATTNGNTQVSSLEKKLEQFNNTRQFYKKIDALKKKIRVQERVILTAQTKIKNYQDKLADILKDF